MKKFLVSLILLISIVGKAQDRIITQLGTTIPSRIEKASPQNIIFINTNNNLRDSIETEKVTNFYYKDSLRMVVLPIAEKEKTYLLPKSEWLETLKKDNLGKVLQSRTILNDLVFLSGKVDLTLDSKKKLNELINDLKTINGLHIELTTHTDTVGRISSNQAISDRRAIALKEYFKLQGINNEHLTTIGKGETEPVFEKSSDNRRVELRITKIDKVQLFFAEKYIPPKIIVVEKPVEVIPNEAKPIELDLSNQSQEQQVTKEIIKPKSKKTFAISFPLEAFYTIDQLSPGWSDKDNGLGILQGFGAGLMLNFYLTPKIGLTFQSGVSRWQVQRRFLTETVLQFTSDETLLRIPLQLGAKLYLTKNVYFQPMAGGVFLKKTTQNSDTNPDGNNIPSTQLLKLGIGSAIGFEVNMGAFFLDFAGQYNVIPNKDFNGIGDPLHFAGIRAAIGFKTK